MLNMALGQPKPRALKAGLRHAVMGRITFVTVDRCRGPELFIAAHFESKKLGCLQIEVNVGQIRISVNNLGVRVWLRTRIRVRMLFKGAVPADECLQCFNKDSKHYFWISLETCNM